MSGFNFDESFSRHSKNAMLQVSQEIELLQKRRDEYDQEYFISYMFSTSLSVCLQVVKHVLEDYDDFLNEEDRESL